MTERPRVLVELGDELDRAAQRVLTGRRRRLNLGAVTAAVAASCAVAVAVVAILLIGHRHPGPGRTGGSVTGALVPRGEIVDGSGRVLVGSRRSIDVQIIPADLPVPVASHPAAAVHHPSRCRPGGI